MVNNRFIRLYRLVDLKTGIPQGEAMAMAEAARYVALGRKRGLKLGIERAI